MLWETLIVTCIKLILIPTYHSTDFEVHRNWLAITHSLPLKKWYFEDTSIWTLDYPPLFAWMEFTLSHIAKFFDTEMLVVNNLNYKSTVTIIFQRLSVIVTDFLLIYGSTICCKNIAKDTDTKKTLYLLLISNVGLIMVDHIHFQYNGLLLGILLISISNIVNNSFLTGAFWFTILINMKHVYLYMAPIYFIYLFKKYCFTEFNSYGSVKWKSFSIMNLIKVGSIVTSIFVATYLPFYDHIPQIISRLFPFKRGLCHAYWAPNFWALYNIGDKFTTFTGRKLGYNITGSQAVMTGGLVQEFSHTVLPTITPSVTIICVVVPLIPVIIRLWKSTSSLDFIRGLILCAMISFLFSWHVHEKAILLAIIPLSILSITNQHEASTFIFLSTVGHYSLFPLLFPKYLAIVKFMLVVTYLSFAYFKLSKLFHSSNKPLLSNLELLYLFGLIGIFIYENVIHEVLHIDKTLPFLPLMLTSTYCALGVIYSCMKYYIVFVFNVSSKKKIK